MLSADGEILTNYHVVEGASSITVTISNGSKRYRASVIGSAPADDIAVLKAEGASDLATVEVGDSSNLSVGDRVVAIGNALNQPGDPAVTEGAVTGLDRSISVRSEFGGDRAARQPDRDERAARARELGWAAVQRGR